MTIKSKHPFHMVDMSPWPLTGAIGTFILTSGLTMWFNMFNIKMVMLGAIIIIITAIQWWRDISREGTLQGLHTNVVYNGLRWGMILFIISEIMFFFSFFWAFFHSSLSPTLEIGLQWPPKGIYAFNPFQVPLLNTIILLSSGVSVTWAHHSIMENSHSKAIKSLFLTIILGIYFTFLQGIEYWEASFSISDSIYGSTFFIATGFHGIHVIVGTIFLSVCLMRMMMFHFSSFHHFGFEAAAWYWHFVDVVWLFLYLNIYWWGS